MNSNKLQETKVMAKTKEKEVFEEVKEKTKSEKTTSKKKDNTPEESTLYYFYSVGCGFCKKADPVVDEFIKEGHDILKLDLAEKDNQGLKAELEKKYKRIRGNVKERKETSTNISNGS